MKPSQPIGYEILDCHKNFGEGRIETIVKGDMGYWRSIIECLQVAIRCGLKYTAEITTIKLKLDEVDMVELRGYAHSQ